MPLFVSLLLLVYPATAVVISGIVHDPDGQLIAGATVRIEGEVETKTREDGAYQLEVAEAGEHKLIAEFDGFVP